jgi:hypothetical protein
VFTARACKLATRDDLLPALAAALPPAHTPTNRGADVFILVNAVKVSKTRRVFGCVFKCSP